jgi:hypothetical protein
MIISTSNIQLLPKLINKLGLIHNLTKQTKSLGTIKPSVTLVEPGLLQVTQTVSQFMEAMEKLLTLSLIKELQDLLDFLKSNQLI